MIDEAAVQAAIDRVWNIAWQPDPARLGSQTALMREYLRRAALVAEALGTTADWPWDDAAARVTLPGVDSRLLPGYVFLEAEPEYSGPDADPLEARIIALSQHLSKPGFVLSPYARKICFWFIRWESVKNHPTLAALRLPDLYEPLIAFYERGGWFKPEQGYVDLDGAAVTLAGWRAATLQAALPSLAPADLNRLDIPNGRKTS